MVRYMNKIQKAELWDNMHFMFREYNDRMVHVDLTYDYVIDPESFKTVLICFLERAPILHASFQKNALRNFWEVAKYRIDDVVMVAEPKNIEEAKTEFLMQYIPPESELQMKIALFYEGKTTHLCLVVNHMCMDGGDLKYFLYALAKAYSDYVERGISPVKLRMGDRAFETVYDGFEEEDKEEAKHLYKNVCSKDDHKFPLTPPSETDASFLVKRKISKEMFLKLKENGKAHGATINDVLVAAYIDSLYRLLSLNADEALSVACAMDLRRYKKDRESDGLTNQTAFMQCGVSQRGVDIWETLAAVTESSNEAKQDKFAGLYGLPILAACYKYLPHALSEKIIKLGYRNPYISMSNIGVLDAKKLAFCDVMPKDGYMSGAVKYKPFVLLSATTLQEVLTLSMCTKGSKQDRQLIEHFFDLFEESLQKLAT